MASVRTLKDIQNDIQIKTLYWDEQFNWAVDENNEAVPGLGKEDVVDEENLAIELKKLNEENTIAPPFEETDLSDSSRVVDDELTTPLIYAVKKWKSIKLIRGLLNNGADISMPDAKGHCAVYYVYHTSERNAPWRDALVKEFMSLISDVAKTDKDDTTSEKNEKEEKDKERTTNLTSSSSQAIPPSKLLKPPASNNFRRTIPLSKLPKTDLNEILKGKELKKSSLERAFTEIKKGEVFREKEDETIRKKQSVNEDNQYLSPAGKQICLGVSIFLIGAGIGAVVFIWHPALATLVCVLGFAGVVTILSIVVPILTKALDCCGLFGHNNNSTSSLVNDHTPIVSATSTLSNSTLPS